MFFGSCIAKSNSTELLVFHIVRREYFILIENNSAKMPLEKKNGILLEAEYVMHNRSVNMRSSAFIK